LADYYSGDDVVDVIGLSLYGLQRMVAAFYGGDRSFSEAFQEKYARVASFGKPVIIAELGVSGSPRYRARWFTTLFQAVLESSRFRHLYAVVYFNVK